MTCKGKGCQQDKAGAVDSIIQSNDDAIPEPGAVLVMDGEVIGADLVDGKLVPASSVAGDDRKKIKVISTSGHESWISEKEAAARHPSLYTDAPLVTGPTEREIKEASDEQIKAADRLCGQLLGPLEYRRF